jgi:hypothetical protein
MAMRESWARRRVGVEVPTPFKDMLLLRHRWKNELSLSSGEIPDILAQARDTFECLYFLERKIDSELTRASIF